MSKKMLSVVLAVAMLISCFAIAASAYTYAPTMTTGEVKISATADNTTVNPGDTVTISMRIDTGSLTNMSAFGNVILYNSTQLTPGGTTAQTFRTWEGDCAASFANPNAVANFNYNVSTQLGTLFTAEEKDYFDKAVMVIGSGTSSADRWNPAPNEAYMSFKMVVSENVEPGDEIWVGTHQAAFTKGASYFAQEGKRLANTAYDITNSMVKLTVGGGAVSGPSVAKNTAQVKLTANADKTDVDWTAAKPFQFRVISEIPEADWNTYCGANGENVKSVGFVAYKGDAAFDMATAKAVAAGTAAEGYAAARTDYIQKREGESAKFAARIDFTAQANVKDVTYVGFVEMNDGSYAFYEAAGTALLGTNYAAIVSQYLANN